MSKILLTGATGFLGSHLLKGLLERTNFEIVILKRSFSDIFRIEEALNNPRVKSYDIDKTELENIFEENKIETILHCATNYGRNNENISAIVESNLIFPLKLLQIGIKMGVKNFINTDTVIDKNVNHYSLSKSQFSDWLKEYSSQINCINVELEQFYGAFDNKTKFTTFIINQLLNNAEKIDLTLGEQKRYFIYIDDVVDAFLTIIENINKLKESFTVFEVSSENNIKIKDFVLLAKELTNNKVTKLNFGAVPYRENELMESKTDITLLKKLGWSPKISLESGLEKMINEERSRSLVSAQNE